MKLNIIGKRKIWFTISGILVGLSLVGFFTWGLNLGIDFTGGSLMEVQFAVNQRPEVQQVVDQLADLNLKSLTIQPTDQNGLIFRFQDTSEETHQAILQRLKELDGPTNITDAPAVQVEGDGLAAIDVQATPVSNFEELRFESVGPAIGQELRRKAIWSMILVLAGIMIYVAYAFRKVSKPVASWKYGLAGIAALFHDVVIVVGLFTVLGKLFQIEVNTSFVAALLLVLGYSIADTIVVFDRIRENLPKSDLDFSGTINFSINQTFVRSLNTSVTVLLALSAIAVFGGESIRYFAMALLAGIFVGTYSSIFLASPLLLVFEKWKRKG